MSNLFGILACIYLLTSVVSMADNVLPFGSYDLDESFTPAVLAMLHDTLGFNIFVDEDILTCTDATNLHNAGIEPVYLNKGSIQRYSSYNYAELWTNIDSFYQNYRLYWTGGDSSGGYWVSSHGSTDTLYGPDRGAINLAKSTPYHKLERINRLEGGGPIEYNLDFRIKIDTLANVDSVVAYVAMAYHDYSNDPDTLFVIDSVLASECDTAFTVETGYSFQIPDSVRVKTPTGDTLTIGAGSIGAAIVFATTGIREVSVEWVKIYDETGQLLVEQNFYNPNLFANADTFSSCKENLWGWYTRDEPYPTHMRPTGYILGFIRDTLNYQAWDIVPAHNARNAVDYWFEVVPTSVIASDYYPFRDNVNYSGYDSDDTTYFQASLINMADNYYDGYHDAASSSGNEFWVYPQAFGGCDTKFCWRRPTVSDFKCQTYMALACGTKGIIYWKYDCSLYSGTNDTLQGLRLLDGTKSDLWYAVKNDINPYIKAIDSTYLGLTWNAAYGVNYENELDPPNDAWIDTIYAVSDTPNPDLDWFHVGEFTQSGSDDKYVIVVNRACNVDDETLAPSITATIKFDTSSLGLGNYVEIIDIATGTDSSDWVGIPDTTFASSMGGKITYSTEFDAGEGRLFKLVGVDADLQNPVTDSINVSKGLYILLEDWVIDDTGIVVLDSGVTIYAHPDSQVEIWCGGKIYANGDFSDSICFIPYSSSPEQGDWTGIEFYSDSAAMGTFQYCSIRYAEVGIELKQNVPVTVSHCNISNCEDIGIYNSRGNLKLTRSILNGNGIYGVSSYCALDSVTESTFDKNGSYGVKIDSGDGSAGNSHIGGNTFTEYEGEDASQYGIYILRNNNISLEGCTVRYFGQGGIRISGSNATIEDCDLVDNDYYGIYTEGSCQPEISETVFDGTNVGLKAVSAAIPVLGRAPDTSKNAFYYCDDYFVYFDNSESETEDTLWAQNCWWNNGEQPDPDKFYTDDEKLRVIVYEPWLEEDPRPKLAAQIPLKFSLNQNYPNPFNPNTIISFSLEKPANTVVTVYNVLGQVVATPVNEYLEAGNHAVTWDGKSNSGTQIASGVYFYTIQTGDHFDSKKMLLLK